MDNEGNINAWWEKKFPFAKLIWGGLDNAEETEGWTFQKSEDGQY